MAGGSASSAQVGYDLKKALCIGISQFQDPYVSPLAGGANDAILLATMLQQRYGFEAADVRLLTDEAATRSAIVTGLRWLSAGTAPGDVLVLTLATHGTRTIDRNKETGPSGEAGGNEKIFLTYDCAKSNHLLRDDVRAALDRVPTGVNCYCIIDTCDVGPFYYATRLDAPEEARPAVRSDPKVRYRDDAETERRSGRPSREDALNRVEITGCAEREQSFDLPEDAGCQGLFTHALYHTLERHAWDMTVGAVYEQVRSTVTTLAESMKVRQTPQLRAPRHLMNKKIFR